MANLDLASQMDLGDPSEYGDDGGFAARVGLVGLTLCGSCCAMESPVMSMPWLGVRNMEHVRAQRYVCLTHT